MQKLLIASLVLALCLSHLSAQDDFVGTLHYTHKINYDNNDARKEHREKLKELANTVAYPQIAMLKSGELEHRRSYAVQPDKLLSTIRDISGKKILEYRVQQPNYAFRVDHASQSVTNPMLVVEMREGAKAAKQKGFETVNGFDCIVYSIKYKGGEVTIWVTDSIVMPTHLGYFSEILLHNKVIVRSVDKNKAEGREEICELAHVDYEKVKVSLDDILALEVLYKDTRTVEKRMLVRSAGLRSGTK